MTEKLIVKNFGGIKDAEILLNRFNILIGPQASGKSILAKLMYYFKSFPDAIFISAECGDRKSDFDEKMLKRFEDYFPPHTWTEKFSIRYEVKDLFIEITRETEGKVSIDYHEFFDSQLTSSKNKIDELKKVNSEADVFSVQMGSYGVRRGLKKTFVDKFDPFGFSQHYIPAGRSFFANLQAGIFSFLSSNKAIDPFLIAFGSFYENIKNIEDRRRGSVVSKRNSKKQELDDLFEEVLCSQYIREKDKDYLLHKDKRKINLSYASSGQQETLPLMLILKTMGAVKFSSDGATLFIEEPEAHLFPSAQKLIVEFVAYVFNQSENRLQFVITTHSPYILASLNNLMFAGHINENLNKNMKEKLNKVVASEKIVLPKDVCAYSLKRGKSKSIICPETKIIAQSVLDEVSEDIAIEFDKLLGIDS
jgi:AAA15 family ATPase/GTPase